jgi:DNA polymerase
MARPTKAEIARQLRGHIELLAAGGLTHIKTAGLAKARRADAKAASPGAAHSLTQQGQVTGATSAPAGAQIQARSQEAAPAGKPVIVPSVALAELKQFSGPRAEVLARLAEQVRQCGACRLCATRTQTVFGTGNPNSRLMIVGEAPGGDEDAQGRPFVGRAGQLLTEIIEKGMKFKRAEVYIANVLKCRPPNNRNPEPDEIASCRPFLEQQIETINPSVLLAVGKFPAQWLSGSALPIGKLRGQKFVYRGRPVVCTYHPAYLLRNYTLETRKQVHSDVLLALEILGKESVVRAPDAP